MAGWAWRGVIYLQGVDWNVVDVLVVHMKMPLEAPLIWGPSPLISRLELSSQT